MKMTFKRVAILVVVSFFVAGLCIVRIDKVCSKRIGQPNMFERMVIYADSGDAIEVVTNTAINSNYQVFIDAKPTCDIIEEPIVEEEIVIEPLYDEYTVDVLTNLLYGEARGVKSTAHKAAVIWCVLNRYDTGKYGDTIIAVATAKNQFLGYKANRVFKDMKAYEECKAIVIDVLDRYYTEEQIGRVLPKDYLWFVANKSGTDNLFTNKWKSKDYWDWSLEDPYVE